LKPYGTSAVAFGLAVDALVKVLAPWRNSAVSGYQRALENLTLTLTGATCQRRFKMHALVPVL
jgi:hypothetical protein